jgi:hypothetical protein
MDFLKPVLLSTIVVLLITNNTSAQWRRDYRSSGNLTVYTLNDNLNASWTVNTDDYRSFGLGGSRSFKKPFELALDYYGLTKRKGFPLGEGMRLDELSAILNYRLSYLSGYQRFSLNPGIGILFAGDLKSQTLQNVTHRAMSLPEVKMGYATKFLPTAVLCGSALYGFTDTVFHGTEFSLTARARYSIRPQYDSRMELGVFTSLVGEAGDLFQLDFFNRYCKLFSRDPVLRYVSDAESGWIWRYEVKVGGFYIANEFGINNGFSTGSIGLSITPPKKEHPFDRADFIFECGILPGKSGWIAGLKAHPWIDGKFNLKVDYVFMVPEDIEYPEFRINQQQLTFGGEWSLFPVRKKLTVSPFAGLSAGIFRGMRYSGVVDTVVEVHASPVIVGEVGVCVGGLLPIRFLPVNVLYGISLSDRFTMPARKYTARCENGTIEFVVPYNCLPVKVSVAIDF